MVDLNQPIVPAPGGYVVDLENPQRRGEAVITWVGVVGMVIATSLLIVRAYTKLVLVKKLSSDDCKSSLYTPCSLANNSVRVSPACVGRCLETIRLINTSMADIP